jgi:primosomal protein N' (replication factor Y)
MNLPTTLLADVVLPGRRFQIFTYQIPPHLLSQIGTGSPVVVPLGSSVVSGVVVRTIEPEAATALPIRFRHKPLRAILSLESHVEHQTLEHNLLKLVEKISEFYLAPLAACLRLIVPPRSFPIVKRIFLSEKGRSALSQKALSPEIRSVLRKLEQAPSGLLRSSLTRTMKDAPAILSQGKKKGWIIEHTTISSQSIPSRQTKSLHSQFKPVRRNSPGLFDLPEHVNRPSPESGQQKNPKTLYESSTGNQLLRAMQSGSFQELPVVGPESLRQNLLVQLIPVLRQQGQRALLLAPEIHQAETLAMHLRDICGEQVEVYHGYLPIKARTAQWERIRQGEGTIVVGTRSALFLPIPRLGLIWIDQENDPAFQEEHLPYYHARQVARMRGEIEQTLVVYGSTCPSLEIYGQFREHLSGSINHVWQHVSQVEMVHMGTLPYGTLVSPLLLAKMAHALDTGEQVILLLNRKGFSACLLCRDCGLASSCSTCGVPLKLFHRPARLICSYCQHSQSAPETCPTCHGSVFRFPGTGTQRLEEEMKQLFPSGSIGRFDRENVKTDEAADIMLRQFRQQEIHVLIGTEFVVHQSDPPTANVIGLPDADLGLHIPDFRSAERTFHLLSKVLPLARNAIDPATVILQTRLPHHHVLDAIAQQQPQVFYDQELELRAALGYPPTTHVIMLVVTGKQLSRVHIAVEFLRQRLSRMEAGKTTLEGTEEGMPEIPMVLGPIPSRKAGRSKIFRMLFLMKTHDLPKTQQWLRGIQQEYETELPKEPVVFEIQVDPGEIV